MKRCLLVLVLVVHVRSGVDQQLNALDVPAGGSDVDRQVVVLVVQLEKLTTSNSLE